MQTYTHTHMQIYTHTHIRVRMHNPCLAALSGFSGFGGTSSTIGASNPFGGTAGGAFSGFGAPPNPNTAPNAAPANVFGSTSNAFGSTAGTTTAPSGLTTTMNAFAAPGTANQVWLCVLANVSLYKRTAKHTQSPRRIRIVYQTYSLCVKEYSKHERFGSCHEGRIKDTNDGFVYPILTSHSHTITYLHYHKYTYRGAQVFLATLKQRQMRPSP